MKSSQPARSIDYVELVHRIESGDTAAEAELYQIFSSGVRFLMMRRLRNSNIVEDELHTSFIITVQSIRNGTLREPERLMGFVRTVVGRRIAEYIEQEMFRRNRMVDAADYLLRDRRSGADEMMLEQEQREIAWQVLSEMSRNDRQVLVRFYLQEQPPEQICREMHLTETQYRLLKNRAKTRFAQRGMRKITRRGVPLCASGAPGIMPAVQLGRSLMPAAAFSGGSPAL